MAQTARAEALYSGYVQGVGFRYTARQTAFRFPVTGYVQNLNNGMVKVVAEGARPDVQAFLDAVRQEMTEYIDDVQISWGVATGESQDFRIRV